MANGALPWIVFERDRERFDRLFPELTVGRLEYRHPLVYLLSGGVSQRQLCPDRMMGSIKTVEKLLKPLNPVIGLFMRVVVKRG